MIDKYIVKLLDKSILIAFPIAVVVGILVPISMIISIVFNIIKDQFRIIRTNVMKSNNTEL